VFRGIPKAQGLYDPAYEHDACGVGFVVSIRGERSHEIVLKGLQVLDNLTHRGACGCDPLTGDGAGILLQIPDAFFRNEADALGFSLPESGAYAVGSVFMPRDAAERDQAEQVFEKVVRQEGQEFLGWRTVPVVESACGYIARRAIPTFRQIFIGRGPHIEDTDAFERKLYVIRRRVENEIRAIHLNEDELF